MSAASKCNCASEATLWALETSEVILHLKKIVEGEGYVFNNRAKPSSCCGGKVYKSALEVDMRLPVANEVVFFGREEHEVFHFGSLQPESFGALFKTSRKGTCSRLPVSHIAQMTKQRIVGWLKAEECICIVCFGDESDRKENDGVKTMSSVCRCGANICFGCVLDLILVGVDDVELGEMEYKCPNCRRIDDSMGNLEQFYSALIKAPSLCGLSGTQRALLKKYTGFDGSKKALRSLPRKKKLMKERSGEMVERMRGNGMSDDEIRSKLSGIILSEINQQHSAASSAAATAARNCCGNCAKEFWDAKAKKRAPKCVKCMRVTYCNAKCRKAHKKTHAPMCKKTDKRKAAKKPAKKRKPKPSKAGKKQSAAKSCCKPY